MRSDIYKATVKYLKSIDGRCTLKLNIMDINTSVKIDVHDSLCETLGISNLSRKILDKICYAFPNQINVTKVNGYWEILNESQLLSDVLSKVSLD